MPLGLAIRAATVSLRTGTASLSVGAALLSASDDPPLYPTDATIATAHDTVTNFAKLAVILSVQSGNWSDGSTWDLGRAPQAGEVVGIQTTHTVTYDVNSTTEFLAIGVAGTLKASRSVTTKLCAQTIVVFGPVTLGTGNYGFLDYGTSADPIPPGVTAEVVFNDAALIDANTGGVTNKEYSNGLLCWGKARTHGVTKTDFVECTANLAAGATTLSFQSAVTGWAAGDTVLIPDTRQFFDEITYSDAIETKTISAVAGDNLSVTVPALSDAHPRAVDKDGNQDFAPEVANLSRNVIFRSENPDGTRGHCLFTGRADVDIRYTRFAGLGRTKNQSNPNTTTNQKGRYPVHLHHLLGPGDGTDGAGGLGYDAAVDPAEFNPASGSNTRNCDGPTFRMIGCVVEDTVTSSPDTKWPITLHGSSDGLIKSNVVYKGTGALYMNEDGTEVYNVIQRNFLCFCYNGTTDRGDASYTDGFPGREGNGFSLPNACNYLRDNRVYNTAHGPVGYNNAGQNSTAYHFYGGNNKTTVAHIGAQQDNYDTIKIAAWCGADPTANYLQRYNYPVLEFSDNECCSCEVGWTAWFLGTSYTIRGPEEIAESVVLRYNSWHCRVAMFNYPTANLTVQDGKWRGSFTSGEPVMGLSTTDYQQRNHSLVGVDIQGYNYGVFSPLMVGCMTGDGYYASEGTTTFEDLTLANRINVFIETMRRVGSGADLPPRVTVVRNCSFFHPSGWTDDLNLLFYPDNSNGGCNWINSDRMYFYDIDGVAGDDIRVYWTQQAPDFITPQSIGGGMPCVGSPDAGQTNTQNLSEHGVCVAGVIWSGTDTRAGFDGYVEAISG